MAPHRWQSRSRYHRCIVSLRSGTHTAEQVCAELDRLRTPPPQKKWGLIGPTEVPTGVLEVTARLRQRLPSAGAPVSHDFHYRRSANCRSGA